MNNEPIPGRARAVVERFEACESDPVAHLTDAQKQWKPAKLRPAAERFVVVAPETAVVKRLSLATPGATDQLEQAATKLAAAVRQLLALGARPDLVAEAVADMLAGKA